MNSHSNLYSKIASLSARALKDNYTYSAPNKDDLFFEDQSQSNDQPHQPPHTLPDNNKIEQKINSTLTQNPNIQKTKTVKPKSKKIKQSYIENQKQDAPIPDKSTLSYYLTKEAQILQDYDVPIIDEQELTPKDRIIRQSSSQSIRSRDLQPPPRKIVKREGRFENSVVLNQLSQYSEDDIQLQNNRQVQQKKHTQQVTQTENEYQIISVHSRSRNKGPFWFVVKQRGKYREVSEQRVSQQNPEALKHFDWPYIKKSQHNA